MSCLMGNRDSLTASFARERVAIDELVRSSPVESLGQRVLIARPAGLENSSRCWSVLVTLDHLRIANLATARGITASGNGVPPEGRASTAEVKPGLVISPAVIAEHAAACDFLMESVAEVTELKTPVRFADPWFGPLDAFGWHAMSGMHMGIHRVQIERIIQGLSGVTFALATHIRLA